MSKISLITITLLLGLVSFAAASAQSYQNHQDEVVRMYNTFKEWVGQANKQYGIEELAFRFATWKENYDFVQDQNLKGNSFELELNNFGDMTGEEFSALHLGFDVNLMQARTAAAAAAPETQNDEQTSGLLGASRGGKKKTSTTSNLPKKVDWRLAGAVTPVKNQKTCGGCWAFSVTGALEGLMAIKTNTIASLSEQQLIDCSVEYGNMGCSGGVMELAFNYTKDKGVQLESDYEYKAENGTCKYNAKKTVFKNTNYTIVPANNSEALKAAVAQQPVSVAIEASSLTLQLFKSGVLSEGCSTNIDHAVLVVGYDTTPEGKDYWIVKNSWGPKWGDKGYIYIAAGNQNGGLGVCGINIYASYPTL